MSWKIFGNIFKLIGHNLANMECSADFFTKVLKLIPNCSKFHTIFCGRLRVFQIGSHDLNYISKGPPTHRGVYLSYILFCVSKFSLILVFFYFEHLEQFGVSFKTFKKFPRNVPRKIPRFPYCVILCEALTR